MNNHKENIDELLKRFLGEKEAQKAAEDIAKGDELLRSYYAPVPDEEAIIVLKSKVAKAVAANRQRVLRRTYYGVAAFAAAVIMVAFVSAHLSEHKPIEPVRVTTTKVISYVSDDTKVFYDDAEIETLNAEVEQVGNEIVMSEWDTEDGNLDSDLIDMEIGLIDINSDFWKG